MTICPICFETSDPSAEYHPSCVYDLFQQEELPSLNIETGRLHTLALAMIGHTSISGVQRKISVRLSDDRRTLRVASSHGNFILKPDAQTYPALPENEALTQNLARRFGLETAPSGLIRLEDDSLAFITARFDRPADGTKLHQEDFCQLAEKSPKEKYDGSSELCARLLHRYATEPGIELAKLFRQLVFSWWIGNGDLHLKNLSVLVRDGRVTLSPAYDLVATHLIIPEDPLALSVGGKNSKLTRRHWQEFASYLKLGPRAAGRILDLPPALLGEFERVIQRAPLPDDQTQSYLERIQRVSRELSRADSAS